ncbi:MAG: hypothetical protein LBQ98_02475 [Nitrososphaerota archaeon]|nr:hypothetical protein [Nitrososphaerota archaeon]
MILPICFDEELFYEVFPAQKAREIEKRLEIHYTPVHGVSLMLMRWLLVCLGSDWSAYF